MAAYPAWDQDSARVIVAGLAHLEGATLPMLHALQGEFGYVDPQAVPLIAEVLTVARPLVERSSNWLTVPEIPDVTVLGDRTRLKLTLRAKRLGLSLTEAKEIIQMYDSPRDTGAQLQKYLDVLALHRKQVEAHMVDMQSNLDELKTQEKEARALLAKAQKAHRPR